MCNCVRGEYIKFTFQRSKEIDPQHLENDRKKVGKQIQIDRRGHEKKEDRYATVVQTDRGKKRGKFFSILLRGKKFKVLFIR